MTFWEIRPIIRNGSYLGANLGQFERSLRDSYGIAGLMKGAHTFPRGWAIPMHLVDGWLAIFLSGRGDQMNEHWKWPPACDICK